jgi:glycosyltransferase involved in cell wall biosynthesis
MRVAVYTDYTYHQSGGEIHADRAFALFVARLAAHCERLVVLGRLDPAGQRARYPIGSHVDFVALPFYSTLARPFEAMRGMRESVRTFRGALDDVDVVWLLGPHPLALVFARVARRRGKRVVLGVRQDSLEYMRTRHPGKPHFQLLARLMEGAWRRLARRMPVVAVGPAVARRYAHSPAVLEIVVSLISETELVDADVALARDYGDELTALSVGRLETEKNPLLLADVLAAINGEAPHWRLVVCGEGALEGQLRKRFSELGVSARADLRGYISFGTELNSLYRSSHALLHVSWTEGLPQVLLEAFAAGLPVVATDVGGIREAVGDAALLVEPGDAGAAARALGRIAEDDAERRRLVLAGLDYAATHTVETETASVARFLEFGDLEADVY